MKKAMILAVGIFLIFVLLAACGSTRTAAGISIEIPHERYFRENPRPTVLTTEEWNALNDEQRESELTRVANESINSLNACNIDKKTLSEWRKQMEKLKEEYK